MCRLIDSRLSDAISELNDKQTLVDDLRKGLEDATHECMALLATKVSYENDIAAMKNKMEQMVSRSQVTSLLPVYPCR